MICGDMGKTVFKGHSGLCSLEALRYMRSYVRTYVHTHTHTSSIMHCTYIYTGMRWTRGTFHHILKNMVNSESSGSVSTVSST